MVKRRNQRSSAVHGNVNAPWNELLITRAERAEKILEMDNNAREARGENFSILHLNYDTKVDNNAREARGENFSNIAPKAGYGNVT